ncbi:MAG: DNA topoisomerase I, partial [Bacteroidetes bacterium]
EEVMELFKLPRVLGESEGQVVKANVGRFGPYVQVGKEFVSIPKGEDPMTITLDRALELYVTKKTEDANKLIKSFDGREDVQLLNGRYGAYLKIGKDNFKLPKNAKPEELSLEECLEIAASQPKTSGKKRSAKK